MTGFAVKTNNEVSYSEGDEHGTLFEKALVYEAYSSENSFYIQLIYILVVQIRGSVQ
jgi:hypothetical protein